MAFQYTRSSSGGVTPSGVTVATPTRTAIGSGAGGGRITGDNLAAVGRPFLGPNPGGFPTPPTGSGTPIGNPNFPCAAGPEIQPTGTTNVPIDTGTGYYFRHLPNAELQGGNNNVLFTTEFAPATVAQQHMVAFDYYPADVTSSGFSTSQIYNAPTEYVMPPLAIASFSGAPTWNPQTNSAGVGTQLNAIQYVGGECLRMDGNANDFVNIQFDPNAIKIPAAGGVGVTPYGRVVKLSLRYRAWRQSPGDPAGTADPAPSEGIQVDYLDTSENLFLAAWLVPTYYGVSGDVVTKSLGEVNYGARCVQAEHGTGTNWSAHPYTLQDLSLMAAAGPVAFQIKAIPGTGLNQRYIYLDHIEMLVEVVPETRLACAVRTVSNVYNSATNITDSDYSRFSKGRFPGNGAFMAQLGSTPQPYYDLCVREALPVDTSDLLIVQPSLGVASLFEAIGPSLEIPAIMQARQTQENQLQTFTGVVVDGQLKTGVLAPFESVNMSVAAFFADFSTANTGAFWASYSSATPPFNVYGATAASTLGSYFGTAMGAYAVQRVWLNGGTTYAYVQAVVQTPQPFGSPAPLLFQLMDTNDTIVYASASVSFATVSALPDQGNDWKVVEAKFAVAYTPPTSGFYTIVAFSTQSSFDNATQIFVNPWVLSVGYPTGFYSPHTGLQVAAYSYDVSLKSDGFFSYVEDRALCLFCAMSVPATPTVSAQTAAAPTTTCDTTTISWGQVQWTGDATIMAYAVESSLDQVVWTRLAIVETGGSTGTLTYNDYATPWDVPVYYRLQGYRPMDRHVRTGLASAPVTISSNGAVLGFSTASQAFSYSPVDPTQVNLQWTDLNTVTTVQLHGEDFQRALRDTSDRGLKLNLNVLVANLGSCTPGALTVGQQSLAETPFEQLRALQQMEYILVRFPGGPVRRMTIEFGSMTVYTASGVYLAQINLTDVNIDPLLFSANELPPGVV